MKMTPADDPTRQLRPAIYWLLILTSTFAMVGRVLTVNGRTNRTPFLSANDISRWCTIRSLVDHGTYVIDPVIFNSHTGQHDHPLWHTIDKVRHRSHDGREHFYSSKPPLLPTMLAAEYWVIQKLTGATLWGNPFYVGRLMLITSNVLPMVLYFVLMMRLVERYGRTDWGRTFVMACVTWGTFLTTFSVTLNNHLPAAISATIAISATLAIWYDGKKEWWLFALAGVFSAFTAANELPALSFLVATGFLLLLKAPKQTLLAFTPAAATVIVAFFYTTWLAHESLRPPYMHRKDGALIAMVSVGMTSPNEATLHEAHRVRIKKLTNGAVDLSPETQITGAPVLSSSNKLSLARWVIYDPVNQKRYAAIGLDQILELSIELREWDNWYEYEGSHWIDRQIKGDEVEESRAAYAFHVIAGHHGIFSLTPIWILTLIGLGVLVVGSDGEASPLAKVYTPLDKWRGGSSDDRDYQLRTFALMVIALSIVVVSFYLARPLADRNYGGNTSGLRWLFWFTPMWLTCMIPAADRMASCRKCQVVGWCLLALSVLSASYASLNPWVKPWIATYLDYLDQ